MLLCKGSALVEYHLIVAGTVNNNIPSLSKQVSGKYPLEVVCKLSGYLKHDAAVEEEGFDQVMVDDHSINRAMAWINSLW